MTILEVLSSKPLDFVLPLVEREGYSMNRIGFDLHSRGVVVMRLPLVVSTEVKVEEDEKPPGERKGCVELARRRVSYGGQLQERLRSWTRSPLFQ